MVRSDELPREHEDRAPPVFVSHATVDRKHAIAASKALGRRGIECWIASRDIAPGENYQESIVHALRAARAVVLIYSAAANNSDEIKKELSLASRYQVPVVAFRIANVEPSDAFAYELSTRQWIDAYAGWDRAIELLAHRLGELQANGVSAAHPSPEAGARRGWSIGHRGSIWSLAAFALVLLVAGGWWFFRPSAVAAQNILVRLAEFERLSPDLPAGIPDAARDEIIAAFNEGGVVGVSTAPASRSAPAYALAATLRRDGKDIRVIARLFN